MKDAWELDLLREGGARLSAVTAGVLADLRPGLRERTVAQAVEAGLRRAGFDGPAFDTIVASGPTGGTATRAGVGGGPSGAANSSCWTSAVSTADTASI